MMTMMEFGHEKLALSLGYKSLKLIHNLVKERGYTLDGAKTYLKEQNQKSLNNFDIITKLEYVKDELIKIKNQL
jgi:hypothetical protein